MREKKVDLISSSNWTLRSRPPDDGQPLAVYPSLWYG